MRIDRLAGGLFACLCSLASHAGQVMDVDEERISVQMRAELEASPAPGAGAVSHPLRDAPPAEAPVMVEVVAPAPPSVDGSGVTRAASQGLSFADLERFVGRPVTVTTTGERVHRGKVLAASAREVQLQVRRAGGTATYTLRREQVARIDPR